jgi:hypothetical protein
MIGNSSKISRIFKALFGSIVGTRNIHHTPLVSAKVFGKTGIGDRVVEIQNSNIGFIHAPYKEK